MDGDNLTVQQILAELEMHQKARDMGCPTFVSRERVRKALGLPKPEYDLPIGEPQTSNWDVPPVSTPMADLLEFQRHAKAAAVQSFISSMTAGQAQATTTCPPEFGPSALKAAYSVWQLRDMMLRSHATLAGYFKCTDLGDPKLNPPDDDVATPVIVEADPPR